MPSWDFDAARAERLRARDPIRFTFGGREWDCLPIVPLAATFTFVDVQAQDPNAVEAARSMAGFVADVLVPEQVNDWWEALASKDALMDIETLGELVKWLARLYSGRPTSPSIGSPTGAPNGGRRSSSRRTKTISATSPD